MATTFSEGASANIGLKYKSRFSLQNVFLSKCKVEIWNQHLKVEPCTEFQLYRIKLRTRTENGQILGFTVTKFEYDVILTSQLVTSSSILLFMVDFTILNCMPNFSFLCLKHRNKVGGGGGGEGDI